MSARTHLDEARAHIGGHRYGQAFSALEAAFAIDPNDPDVAAAYAKGLCYRQREFEAVGLLDRAEGGEEDAELRQILADYLHCRRQVLGRLGLSDPETVKAQAHPRLRDVQPGPVGVTLSAVMIARDEAANIGRCLGSIQKLVDEIVVVDTGSQDDSAAIARGMGARVFDFAWIDDFAAARNHALAQATGHWVLWIDADEEMDPGHWSVLREGLTRPHFAGYQISIRNFLEEKGDASCFVHAAVRLFQRRPEVRFDGAIHEQVDSSLALPVAHLDKVAILHHGYRPQAMRERGKVERAISLLRAELAKDPDDAFQRFNLGNALAAAGRFDEAIPELRRAVAEMPETGQAGYFAHTLLANCLTARGRFDEALQAIAEAREAGWDCLPLAVAEADALMRLERFDDALAAAERACEMDWDDRRGGDRTAATLKRFLLLARLLRRCGRNLEACAAYGRALQTHPEHAVCRLELGQCLLELGDPAAAAAELRKATASPATKELAEVLLASIEDAQAVPTPRRATPETARSVADPSSALDEARTHIAGRRHAQACATLLSALRDHPGNPEVHLAYGLFLMRMQREPEALAHVEPSRGADGWNALSQGLVDHFACRRQMADRLGIEDRAGRELLESAQAQTGLEASPDVGISLTACLIVKNEEKHLATCLESLKGLADEIVVVDTGSTDSTVEIAERFGAKIGTFDWCDDFAAARNASLDLATGHWILWIDADEEVDPSAHERFREGLMRPQFGAYSIRMLNHVRDHGGGQYVHTPVRLFRRSPQVRFEGRIHEQVLPSILAQGWQVARLGGALVHHYGYAPEVMREKDKIARTVTMLQRELDEHPNDPFQWFNLANAHMVAFNLGEAEAAARRAVELIESGGAAEIDPGYIPLSYQLLSAALTYQGRSEEALEACDWCVAQGHSNLMTDFERAHALLKLGRLPEALAAIESCMAQEWPDHLTGDYGVVTHKAHVVKGQILYQMGRIDEALLLFDHALRVDPEFRLGLFSKGLTLAAMGRYDEAIPCLEKCFDVDRQGLDAMTLAAKAHLAAGRPEKAVELIQRRRSADALDREGYDAWIEACERLDDLEGMLAAYESYYSEHEPTAAFHINWGRALARAGETERSLACFSEAIRLAPEDSNAYFNCGDVLYAAGLFSDAAHLYETGLRLRPEAPEAWFTFGNCLAQMGVDEGAKIAYSQVLRMDSDHEGARHNLDVVERGSAA